jgi:hypothetical protein
VKEKIHGYRNRTRTLLGEGNLDKSKLCDRKLVQDKGALSILLEVVDSGLDGGLYKCTTFCQSPFDPWMMGILAYHLVVGIASREAWAPKSPCLTKLLPLCQLQGSIGPIHPARDQLGMHGDDTNKCLLPHGPVCLLFISPLGCQRSATSKNISGSCTRLSSSFSQRRLVSLAALTQALRRTLFVKA